MLCLVADSGKIVIFAIFAKFAIMFSFWPFLLLRAFLDISLLIALLALVSGGYSIGYWSSPEQMKVYQ